MKAILDGKEHNLDGDWPAFATWAKSIASGRNQLRHLAQFGWCQDLDTLTAELDAALTDADTGDDPPDVAIVAVGERLLEMLVQNENARALSIDAGIGGERLTGNPVEAAPVDGFDVAYFESLL